MREIGKEKKNNLEEVEKFLQDQVVNNKQLEESIKQSEKQLQLLQENQLKVTEAIGDYTIEVCADKLLKISNSFHLNQRISNKFIHNLYLIVDNHPSRFRFKNN